MKTIGLQVSTPAPRDVWERLLCVDREATPYQSPAWLDSMCEGTGYSDASRLYESAEGRQLILPMVRTEGPFGLETAASWPAGRGVGGLLASSPLRPDDVAMVFAVWAISGLRGDRHI
jgi:hypothetical protein